MNFQLSIALLSILAYLLGSIPTSIWTSKALLGVDIRDYGSGNAGATNSFRILGKKSGIFVLAIDILKGFTAANLVFLVNDVHPGDVTFINLKLLFGICATIGHVFPVFAKFKGGKGIATLFGVILSLHFLSAMACVGVFAIILFATRYVSLGSMLAAAMFPVFTILVFKRDEPLFIAFGLIMSLVVILTHRKNIDRLLKNEESKAKLLKKHRT